jgi:hypothetical protein
MVVRSITYAGYDWDFNKVQKKESTDRLLYTGLFVAIFTSFLDMVGDFLGLWDYRYEVFPLTSN